MKIKILQNQCFVGKIFKVTYNFNGKITSHMVEYIESGHMMIQCRVIETNKITYLDPKNFCRDYIIENYPECFI